MTNPDSLPPAKPSPYALGPFRAAEIIAEANRLLAECGSRTRIAHFINCERGKALVCSTPRGARILVVVELQDQVAFRVKSVLKVRDKRARASWLINGQAGTNTSELVFQTEGRLTIATAERIMDRELERFGPEQAGMRVDNLLEHIEALRGFPNSFPLVAHS